MDEENEFYLISNKIVNNYVYNHVDNLLICIEIK